MQNNKLVLKTIKKFQQIFVMVKTSWRQLSSLSSEDVSKNIFLLVIRLQDVFKSLSRSLQEILPRRLEDVFKRSLGRLAKISLRLFVKISSRHSQDVFKTSSKHLQDVFKMYHQVQLALLTRLQDVSKTYSTRFEKTKRRTEKTIIYRKICLGHTPGKSMVKVQIFQEPNVWICWIF